jgi:hypothetical protein
LRKEIADYLENLSRKVSRKLRYKAIKFVLLDGRLYYKTLDGVLLQCLGQEEGKRTMSEVHDGLCGAHQSAYRMKWVIKQTGCYWPAMLEDCFEYYKGWQDCQVWKYSESSSISFESYYQTMAIQRMGNRLDWPNKSSI